MPYRSLFNVEPHALRERKLHPEIDRVGGPTPIKPASVNFVFPQCEVVARRGCPTAIGI
jgi:hypothetical protein